MRKSKARFWLFLLPALVAFSLIVLIPMLMGFWYAFTDWNGISESAKFVGGRNFVTIFQDQTFLHAFGFTALFAVCAVILVNAVGFALALLVTQKFPGATALRGVFFMPNLIGGLLLGFTWQFIFTSIFSALGQATGRSPSHGWLSTPPTGFPAQLQQIQDSVKEAARIDGAGPGSMLAHITLPLMMPAFTIGLFMTISNSFKMFDQNLALTAGGPYRATEMLALNIYNSAFAENRLGVAQAKAIVFLVVVAAVGITQLLLTKRKEVEM